MVLTVLSCIAGNTRVRSAMAQCQARRRLVEFGQHIPDPRLRARSLSLVKVRLLPLHYSFGVVFQSPGCKERRHSVAQCGASQSTRLSPPAPGPYTHLTPPTNSEGYYQGGSAHVNKKQLSRLIKK